MNVLPPPTDMDADNQETASTELKTAVCVKCGKTLPVTAFYISKKSKSGFQSYCKECTRIYRSARHMTLPEPKPGTISLHGGDPRLANITPRELVAELRRRGYFGDLYYKQHIKV